LNQNLLSGGIMGYIRILISLCAIFGFPIKTLGDSREDDCSRKCVALTFDDGPDNNLTPRLLTILRENHILATFYVLGSRVVASPNIIRDMQRDGHEIGNHTWGHPDLTKLSSDAITREIERTDQALRVITGETPRTIRPPYGAINQRVRRSFNRPFVLWDVDTLDWLHRSVSWIVNSVTSQVRPGSIVLMHDIHPTTIAAVPLIIKQLMASGYVFATVSQLKKSF